jgi:Lambda phage tail tube protein, TTP
MSVPDPTYTSNAMVTNRTKIQLGNGATPEIFTDIKEVISITPPAQTPVRIDVSHLLSPARENRPGLPGTGEAEFKVNYLPGDTVHRQLMDEQGANVLHNWRVMFPPDYSQGLEFEGGVGSFSINAIELDNPITATVSLVSSPQHRIPVTP